MVPGRVASAPAAPPRTVAATAAFTGILAFTLTSETLISGSPAATASSSAPVSSMGRFDVVYDMTRSPLLDGRCDETLSCCSHRDERCIGSSHRQHNADG